MLLLSCDKFQILTSRWREFKIKSHERDLSWLVTKLTQGEFQRWPWDLQFSLLYIILKASQSIYNPPCWSPSLSTGSFCWRMIKRMIASRWEPVFFFFTPLSALPIHLPSSLLSFLPLKGPIKVHWSTYIFLLLYIIVLVRILDVLAINIIIWSVVYIIILTRRCYIHYIARHYRKHKYLLNV